MSIKVYTKFCNVFFQCGVVDEYYWIKILLRKYHYSIGSVLGYKKTVDSEVRTFFVVNHASLRCNQPFDNSVKQIKMKQPIFYFALCSQRKIVNSDSLVV